MRGSSCADFRPHVKPRGGRCMSPICISWLASRLTLGGGSAPHGGGVSAAGRGPAKQAERKAYESAVRDHLSNRILGPDRRLCQPIRCPEITSSIPYSVPASRRLASRCGRGKLCASIVQHHRKHLVGFGGEHGCLSSRPPPYEYGVVPRSLALSLVVSGLGHIRCPEPLRR